MKRRARPNPLPTNPHLTIDGRVVGPLVTSWRARDGVFLNRYGKHAPYIRSENSAPSTFYKFDGANFSEANDDSGSRWMYLLDSGFVLAAWSPRAGWYGSTASNGAPLYPGGVLVVGAVPEERITDPRVVPLYQMLFHRHKINGTDIIDAYKLVKPSSTRKRRSSTGV